MPFPFFPYCDFHALNADWILKKMRQMCAFIKTKSEEVDTAVESIEGYNARLTDAEDNIRTLQNSAVSYAAEQHLTPEQKTRARGNISAAPAVGVVYYNEEQLLSDAYKETARDNIGAASAADLSDVGSDVQTLDAAVTALQNSAVSYAAEQHLTPEQKTRARENISAAPAVGVVYYNEEQLLSDAYKETARDNIGAASAADLSDVNGDVQVLDGRVDNLDETAPYVIVMSYYGNDYHLTATPEQVYNAVEDGKPVVLSIPSLADFPNAPSGVQVAELTQAVAGVNNGILETRFKGTVSVGTSLSVELVVTIADNSGTPQIYLDTVDTFHLPTPSLADAGKVPTVNNAGTGYNLQSAGGGTPSAMFMDKATGGSTWTSTNTFAELLAQFKSGGPVFYRSADYYYAINDSFSYGSNLGYLNCIYIGSDNKLHNVKLGSNGSLTETAYTLTT